MATTTFTDSGKLVKMDVDYGSAVDEKIPHCEKLAKSGKLEDALDILLTLEKQTRTGADTHSTSRILVCIVQICFQAKNWKLLNDSIVLLTKRRSQIKQSITKMIQECCSFVDQIPDREIMLTYIDTLRTVTSGKIYVEVERARLTYKLAQMKEGEGKVEEAANIMQELQIETFGSMDKREKVELILEQMRLCLAKKDYTRTQIISKKISSRFFEDEKVQDLKLKFYGLMISLDQHERNHLNICKHYQAIFNTPSIHENASKKHEVLKNIILFVVMSPFDNEQSDFIHRIETEKSLEEILQYKKLLKLFTTAELISWGELAKSYEDILRKGTPDCPPTGVFSSDLLGNTHWADFKKRVVEHNVRIIAKYYNRVGMKRMSQLLDLKVDETEEVLSSLVVNKTIWAKVDRLEGIVKFSANKDPNEVLNDWSNNINSLMQHICKINHLINKEEMVHRHLNAPKTETVA